MKYMCMFEFAGCMEFLSLVNSHQCWQ